MYAFFLSVVVLLTNLYTGSIIVIIQRNHETMLLMPAGNVIIHHIEECTNTIMTVIRPFLLLCQLSFLCQ